MVKLPSTHPQLASLVILDTPVESAAIRCLRRSREQDLDDRASNDDSITQRVCDLG